MGELRLDWCSHAAARKAVNRWHYSHSMPTPPTIKIGVCEQGTFIGAVVFSRGNASHLHEAYGISRFELCELSRVALTEHEAPVTQIVSKAVKMLRVRESHLRLIVSFADPEQGHTGVIYQAGNWIYLGESNPSRAYRDSGGRLWHSRMVSSSGVNTVYGKRRRVLRPSDCTLVRLPGKHRYALPLDRPMRRQLSARALPSPPAPEA